MGADAHITAFNDAVRSGAWAAFASRFAEDATLTFVGSTVGPFVGRAAIAAAYEAQPPDDTLARTGGDDLTVPYRWDATGATGTMHLTWSPTGQVQTLTVTFD